MAVFAVLPAIALLFADLWNDMSLFGMTLLLGLFLAQLALILLGQRDGYRRITAFYSQLVRARLGEKELKSDYRDSYRHLREHGNAVIIVILEILLGAILATMKTERDFVGAIVLWLLPAGYAWIIGSVLEGEFVNIKGKVP